MGGILRCNRLFSAFVLPSDDVVGNTRSDCKLSDNCGSFSEFPCLKGTILPPKLAHLKHLLRASLNPPARNKCTYNLKGLMHQAIAAGDNDRVHEPIVFNLESTSRPL